jgi:hypothetical protein
MPEILFATPLKHSVASKAYTFGDGISIRTLAPILWEQAAVRRYVSDDDREYMDKNRYWLCASKEVEYFLPQVGEDLCETALHAAWALQIICPTGAKHVFLKVRKNTAWL